MDFQSNLTYVMCGCFYVVVMHEIPFGYVARYTMFGQCMHEMMHVKNSQCLLFWWIPKRFGFKVPNKIRLWGMSRKVELWEMPCKLSFRRFQVQLGLWIIIKWNLAFWQASRQDLVSLNSSQDPTHLDSRK